MKSFDIMQLQPDLARCATMLEHQRKAMFPHVRYHVLADALYWSDELPKGLEKDCENALRFVLRYRSSVIVGRPEVEYEAIWLAARKLFPKWIGFLEKRSTANQRLAHKLEKFRESVRSQINCSVE